jgi:hypothetical protein
MPITRRTCLSIIGKTAAFGLMLPTRLGAVPQLSDRSGVQRRIGDVIHAYEEQGFHRTGTQVDQLSGEWLASQVREVGLKPLRESFALSRVDPISTSVTVNSRKIEGLPFFDSGFTISTGIRGQLGNLNSDAPIGLTEIAPNTAEIGPLADARRQSRHKAIVVVTRGFRPGFCPSNAESFLRPFGPPVLQVTSEEGSFLVDCARQGLEAVLTGQVERTQALAFNVTAVIPGSNAGLTPLVVMTPRSGWWSCESERGGGLACWLEIMRAMRDARAARDILFVASSGHEIGERGIEIFIERRPGIVTRAKAWIHLGANIGAAQGAANRLQASDDDMESAMAECMANAGLRIDRRIPRGTVPGGEAANVHRAGGRYMSIIGSNELFHNPKDRGPEAVDLDVIERFANAFAMVTKLLASA